MVGMGVAVVLGMVGVGVVVSEVEGLWYSNNILFWGLFLDGDVVGVGVSVGNSSITTLLVTGGIKKGAVLMSHVHNTP